MRITTRSASGPGRSIFDRPGPSQRAGGAAAVEMALVLPLFLAPRVVALVGRNSVALAVAQQLLEVFGVRIE